MMGYRRAAAALHGLNGDDREWILSELPDEDGLRVKKYLEKLNELGFAEDLLFGEVPAFVRRPMRAGSDRASAILRAGAATEVFAVIETEPALLIGRLLTIRDWPWNDELLKMFPPIRQEHIRAAMNGGSAAAPALDKFLVDTLAMRLKDDAKGVKRLTHGWLTRISSLLSRMVRSWSR